MRIVMLGAPGAGKGTQALRMSQKYNIPHISTGDLFRSNIKAGTELGIKAQEYIDEGALVPDEITIGMLLNRIEEDDCKYGYILDGFPRNIPQAEKLTEELKKNGGRIDYAVDIEVPDEHIKERMGGRRVCVNCGETYHINFNKPKVEDICDKCGEKLIIREDDKPETVQKRLDIYHEKTQPLIDYYSDQDVLLEIDGTKDLDDVFAEIVAALGE